MSSEKEAETVGRGLTSATAPSASPEGTLRILQTEKNDLNKSFPSGKADLHFYRDNIRIYIRQIIPAKFVL
jgi:hypothetical protein